MRGIHFSTVSALLLTATSAFPSPSSKQIEARGVSDNAITFDCTIPSFKENLPIFSLGAVAQFPLDKFSKILEAAAPGITRNVTKGEDGSLFFYDRDLLVGQFDRAS